MPFPPSLKAKSRADLPPGIAIFRKMRCRQQPFADQGPVLAMRKVPGGVGRSRTLNWKTLLAVSVPSLTVIVMFATPVCPGSGVTVTVRLLLLPPNTMSPGSTRVGLSELPDKVRFAAGVSASPTVNGIAGVDASTAIIRLVMLEMVGGVSTWLTVTVKAWETILLLVPPSLTVTVIVAAPYELVTGVNRSEPVVLGLV